MATPFPLAASLFPGRNPEGTSVAKRFGMLTFFAFAVALGSVFTSVLWACKEDTANRL
jgi:hypothetical protein